MFSCVSVVICFMYVHVYILDAVWEQIYYNWWWTWYNKHCIIVRYDKILCLSEIHGKMESLAIIVIFYSLVFRSCLSWPCISVYSGLVTAHVLSFIPFLQVLSLPMFWALIPVCSGLVAVHVSGVILVCSGPVTVHVLSFNHCLQVLSLSVYWAVIPMCAGLITFFVSKLFPSLCVQVLSLSIFPSPNPCIEGSSLLTSSPSCDLCLSRSSWSVATAVKSSVFQSQAHVTMSWFSTHPWCATHKLCWSTQPSPCSSGPDGTSWRDRGFAKNSQKRWK